jgi:hypothetical protein
MEERRWHPLGFSFKGAPLSPSPMLYAWTITQALLAFRLDSAARVGSAYSLYGFVLKGNGACCQAGRILALIRSPFSGFHLRVLTVSPPLFHLLDPFTGHLSIRRSDCQAASRNRVSDDLIDVIDVLPLAHIMT